MLDPDCGNIPLALLIHQKDLAYRSARRLEAVERVLEYLLLHVSLPINQLVSVIPRSIYGKLVRG